MGRFETTAATYAARREPYPAAFFATAAAALRLMGTERLIDLGAGPGMLAIGFARYVADIFGVDPEPAMIAEARRAASDAGLSLPLHLGRAEDVGSRFGLFDLVTIGRALHWMDRDATLAALDQMLATGGRILVCGSSSAKDNPWRAAYEGVLRPWSDGNEGHRRAHEHFFDSSRFIAVGEFQVEHHVTVDAEALIERALTRSTTSVAVLGDKADAVRSELREALAPFFGDGDRVEAIEARGRIFVREP